MSDFNVPSFRFGPNKHEISEIDRSTLNFYTLNYVVAGRYLRPM